jgi:hypothetical protein
MDMFENEHIRYRRDREKFFIAIVVAIAVLAMI